MKNKLKNIIVGVVGLIFLVGLLIIRIFFNSYMVAGNATPVDFLEKGFDVTTLSSGVHVKSDIKQVFYRLDTGNESEYVYIVPGMDADGDFRFILVKIEEGDNEAYSILADDTYFSVFSYAYDRVVTIRTREYPADSFDGATKELPDRYVDAFANWCESSDRPSYCLKPDEMKAKLLPVYFETVDVSVCKIFFVLYVICLSAVCLCALYFVVSFIGVLKKKKKAGKAGFSDEVVLKDSEVKKPDVSMMNDKSLDLSAKNDELEIDEGTNSGAPTYNEEEYRHIELPIGTFMKYQLDEVNAYMKAGKKSEALMKLIEMSNCDSRAGAAVIVRWEEYYK